uniref:Retrotransposon gag domain-containing protein n=1 Tax=Tanacetum cinerariifolium TaxID=118510 RepID=A0A699JMK7_TANCI|nr:hypothetical protein [Tanacetum cinerariifolium]
MNTGVIDINTLIIEQYMALTRRDRPGVVIPELGNDVDFEIKSQFMSELKCNPFAGTDDEDAHEHVRCVLEIMDLFHIPGFTHDALMIRVFHITLTGAARRWKNLLPTESITTWDLLEKTFIRKYCPPLKTAKKLKQNQNFKQGVGCKIYKVVHLTEEHSLKEDDKQSSLDERIKKLRDDTNTSFRMLDAATKNLQGKYEQLIQEILTSSMADKAKTIMRSEIKFKKDLIPFDSPNINQYDESTIPPSQFPRYLKEQEDEAQAFRTLEGLKKLNINRSLGRVVNRMPEYLMYVKDVFSSKKLILEKDAVRLNDRCMIVLQSQPPLKENDQGSFTLPCLFGNSKISSALANLGASINVMPFFMFKKLQIGNLQPTNMMVEMVDITKKAPKGIIKTY